MAADKKNSSPSKPEAKPESIRDLPQKKGSVERDEKVKGGRMGPSPHM